MFDPFKDYLAFLEVEKDAAENTLDKRKRNLDEFTEWCQGQGIGSVRDVSRREIARYVDHLVDEGYAPNTTMGKYESVSAAYNYLYQERIIEDNPVERIEWKAMRSKARGGMTHREKKDELGPKDYLTKAEVYEIAENAIDPADRNELLVKLLFWTGIRVSEAVGVLENGELKGGIHIGEDGTLDGPGSDIVPDSDAPKITVYSPKTKEPRVVSYPPEEINPLLRDWISHGRLRYKSADETDRLFIGPKGPLTKSGVGRAIDLSAQKNDMQGVKREAQDGREYKRITAHLLRHSHAMYYHNEQDVSLDTLKDHLGHSTTNTTEKFYAETTEDKVIDTFGG